MCTASASSLGTSQFYSPSTVFSDEDLEAHRRVFCTLDGRRPDHLGQTRPAPERPPHRLHPLEGGSDPPCWRLPFTSRPHVHPCRSLLVAPGSAKQGVVTLFARWASVRTSAHIYAATRHVVGNTQSLTSPRGLTKHLTGRGYAGCCIPTSQNSSSTHSGE